MMLLGASLAIVEGTSDAIVDGGELSIMLSGVVVSCDFLPPLTLATTFLTTDGVGGLIATGAALGDFPEPTASSRMGINISRSD